jgi:hypothetical protein
MNCRDKSTTESSLREQNTPRNDLESCADFMDSLGTKYGLSDLEIICDIGSAQTAEHSDRPDFEQGEEYHEEHQTLHHSSEEGCSGAVGDGIHNHMALPNS